MKNIHKRTTPRVWDDDRNDTIFSGPANRSNQPDPHPELPPTNSKRAWLNSHGSVHHRRDAWFFTVYRRQTHHQQPENFSRGKHFIYHTPLQKGRVLLIYKHIQSKYQDFNKAVSFHPAGLTRGSGKKNTSRKKENKSWTVKQ